VDEHPARRGKLLWLVRHEDGETMRGFRIFCGLFCAAALGGAVSVGVADAGASATFTLQALPGLLAPGGSGAVAATFTNNGPSTLTHVIVNITLPAGATFDSIHSSAACAGQVPVISCALGKMKKGATIVSTVAFGSAPATGPVAFAGTATWDAASVGNPQGGAAKDTVTATAQADVISLPPGFAGASSCHPGGDTLSATADGQSTQVVAGQNDAGLPCTPILAGVAPNPGQFKTDVSFVDLPHLVKPATVVLTFPDERLPWPISLNPPARRDTHAPTDLNEYPNYPDTSTHVVVPVCLNHDTAPAIPPGSDSCIVSVDGSSDPDRDFDAGTMTLLVQGSDAGDPGYIG
jgi:hypothetical protein